MNNNNPFIPQGSLLEQKNRKRARVKYGVFTVFALNILIITPMLIQGCKKEAPTDTPPPPPDISTNVTADTNVPPPLTNAPVPPAATNVVAPVPQAPPPPPPAPVSEAPTTKEYTVTKGDSYYVIAKKFGAKMKDVEAANPTIPATKLKVGQKIQIPASAGTGSSSAPAMSADGTTLETYTVKPGDSLTKIAKHAGTTIKAIRAANNMKTDKIKVGDKLKIPGKAPAPEPAPAPAPEPAPAPAPAAVTPAPASPAPAHN